MPDLKPPNRGCVPAFPVILKSEASAVDGTTHMRFTDYEEGLSIREWFAGRAVTGLLADPAVSDYLDAARGAVLIADLLIAELAKSIPPSKE